MGVDFHYEPPADEAGAYKSVQRATQWLSARSGTEDCKGLRSAFRDRLEVTSCPVVCPGSPRAAEVGLCFRLSTSTSLPPSHIPTDGLLVGRTPERARGPLSIFRKILYYGKTKKSTHGYQTAKPFCTPHNNQG